MIKAWNLGAVLITGLVIGFSVGWWMNHSQSPNVYSVGDYDFIIGDYDSFVDYRAPDLDYWQRDKNDTTYYAGFGVAWPVSPEDEIVGDPQPQLIALIMDGHLEIAAYDDFSPEVQTELHEVLLRERGPKVPLVSSDGVEPGNE